MVLDVDDMALCQGNKARPSKGIFIRGEVAAGSLLRVSPQPMKIRASAALVQMDLPHAKVAERLRKCLQSITTPVRIRTLASHFQEFYDLSLLSYALVK